MNVRSVGHVLSVCEFIHGRASRFTGQQLPVFIQDEKPAPYTVVQVLQVLDYSY